MSVADIPAPSSTEARSFRGFVSYSTDPDYRLSQRVESFLETFHRLKLPEGVKLEPIQICRDGSDFSLQRARKSRTSETVIEDLIAPYLADSEYLIVLCSARARQSRYVDFELRWFIENRGTDNILLAVTEGDDPAAAPDAAFPPAAVEAGLHRLPFYDLRGFRRNAARSWTRVRDAEEELAGLAAFLHGDTSGRLLPLWQREALRKARRQRLLFAAVAVLLAAIAGFALWERDQADSARVRAERALAESQARSLVLAGEAKIEKDPQLSLLLALSAAKLEQASSGSVTTNVSSLLERAVLATPRRIARGVPGIECFAIRPDGKALAVGTQGAGVLVLSLPGGGLLSRYRTNTWVNSVDWSDDGTLLAAGARDDALMVWDTASGKRTAFVRFDGEPQSVDWRPSTRQVAVALGAGDASRAVVWDYRGRRALYHVPGIHAAWSPDGTLLASGGFDDTVYLFDAAGNRLASVPAHVRIGEIAWRPDGTLFATASVDDVVDVWSAPRLRRVVRLPSAFALSVAWRNDGRELASGTGDEFVRVWAMPRFRKIFDIAKSATITGQVIQGSGAAGYVLDVSWSRDGRRFLVADREGGILVYATSLLDAKTTQDWIATGEAQLHRTLTPQEARRLGLPQGGVT